MKIQLTKKGYYLGEPIPVTVTYENPSRSALTLDDPAASFDVEMHLIDGTSGEDLSYTMGQSTATVLAGQDDGWALNVPVPPQVSLAPGSEYSFESDLNERLYLRPGTFDLYLTDATAELESDHLPIKIMLEGPAVKFLAARAMTPAQGYSRREWAMEWVLEVYPDFQLRLPDRSTPPAVAAEYERHNREVYERFLAWWDSTHP